MFIIDNPRKLNVNKRIYIPFYQRGHLSLKDNTQVNVCFIPRDNFKDNRSFSELIITPISYKSWENLWRMSIYFRDYTGVVRDIFKILSYNNISILHYESCTIDNRNLHCLEIIIDISGYIKINCTHVDNDNNYILDLKMKIAALCSDKLHVYDQNYYGSNRPNFKIKMRRVNSLKFAYDDYIKYQKSGINIKSTIFRTKITGGGIALPNEIYNNILKIYYSNELNRCSYPEHDIDYILVSDTKDRVLRVIFPKKDENILYVQVGYDDNIGALTDITSIIASKYDIIASYNHIHKQDNRSYISLIISPIDQHLKKLSQHDLKDSFITMLSEISDYELSVTFPNSAGEKIQNGDSLNSNATMLPFKYSFDISLLEHNTEDALKVAEEYYYKLSQNNDMFLIHCNKMNITKDKSKYEKNRIHNVLEILRRYMHYKGINTAIRSVFISNDSTDLAIHESISNKFKNVNISVNSAASYRPKKQVKSKIIDSITKSDAFIAVWKNRDNNILSPWLLWELGVAQHLNKKVFLMCHNLISKDIKEIFTEKDIIIFCDNDIGNCLETIVKEISDYNQVV